jgi:hypothetical protein
MILVPVSIRFAYNANNIVPGAQTERWGNAWPVRGLLGGKDLAGRFALNACNKMLWTLRVSRSLESRYRRQPHFVRSS